MDELEKIYRIIQKMEGKVKSWTLLIKDIKNERLQKEKEKEKTSARRSAALPQKEKEKDAETLPEEIYRRIQDMEGKDWELSELPVFPRVKMVLFEIEKKNLEKKQIEFKSKMYTVTKSFGFDPAHLKTVYRSLLGGKMNYQMGDLGPHLDIFFVCVLMNHRELAFELWKQCEVPVCAAICAVRLLLYLPQQRART